MSDVKRQTDIKSCLIVCNGSLYKKDLAKFLNNNVNAKPRRANKIIACDGASDFLMKAKIIPDLIIGDLDSITPKAKIYFSSKGVKVKLVKDQDKNDLEKAILYSLSKKYSVINIAGLSGKRFDHSLNNLSVLLKYYRNAEIILHENGFTGRIINKSTMFKSRAGSLVSLIPLPAAAGITTIGLKYPLKNSTLALGRREGALNEAVGNEFSLKFSKGVLLVLIK